MKHLENPYDASPKTSFLEGLEQLLLLTKKVKEIKIKEILTLLSGKGYAALLILLSVPFCFPITIPGTSLPFGILLGFLGLRLAFGKHPWWPDRFLNKSLKSEHVETLTLKIIKVTKSLEKILRPRFVFLVRNPFFHRMHGVVIFFLAFFLALPLPIPMTNILSAFPILFIGLGLLEDDGLAIILGYLLALICFAFFTGILIYGTYELRKF